jgi:pimeloyl-ACP methyl ester carboxylesterase
MPNATAADGTRLYFEVHGTGDNAVLLLMGLGGDAHIWEPQVAPLAARGRVVVYDNRGMGRSDKPAGPYSIATLAADALAVLDAAAVAQADLVGLSMGGMVAAELALAQPARVGKLALLASAARLDEGVRAHLADPVFTHAFAAGDQVAVYKAFGALAYSAAFLDAERDWMRAWTRRALGYGVTAASFRAQLEASLAFDRRADLGRLSAPALVLAAGADRLIPPHHADELARLIPGARLVTVAGADHVVNLERPDAVNAELLQWLGGDGR